MQRYEMFIDDVWLPVMVRFNVPYFVMSWTGDPTDYDIYPVPDYDAGTGAKFWREVRDVYPELMQGDGQDYPVIYPYSRLPALREAK